MAQLYRQIKYTGKQFLYERFGIINYDDNDYQNDIKTIGVEIVKFIRTGCSQYYKGTYTLPPELGDTFSGDYEEFIFSNFCNIDTLRVYICDLDPINVQMILNGFQPYEEDCILLSNEYAKENRFYIQNGCKTKVLSICVNYTKRNISIDNISGLIEHELKHLFDQNKEYKDKAEQMNKDVITSNDIMYDNQEIFNDVKIQRSYKNFITFYNDKKYYNDTSIVPLLLVDLLYYMNKSEVSTRLIQQKYNKLFPNSPKRLYVKYQDICNNIINYASDDVKKCINEYILTYNFSNIYNIKFSNNHSSYISNTNKLFKFYIKRLNHFIKNCDKMLCG